MKFLVIVAGIIALGICGETVRPQDKSYLDQLKLKARQIHKKLDLDKDGHVSLDELTEGIKKGIGLIDEDEEPSEAKKFYQKYITGKKDKKQYLTEEDFEKILKQKSKEFKNKAKETTKEAGETISDKMGKAKEKITETFEDIKDSASQKFSELKDSASKVASDLKASASQKVNDLMDDGEQNVQKLKEKANKIYDKFVKNKNETLSYDNLKEALKSGFDSRGDQKEQDQKTLTDRINKLYQKYVKSDKKDKPISREAFFKMYSQENKAWKEKGFLDKTKQEANKLFNSFDLDKDGHVSMQQIGAGIKSGLGIGKASKQLKDQESIKKYASDLYEKYVKPDEKNRKWFTVQDFSDILGKSKGNKIDCKRIGKLSLDQLKLKASVIHKKLDMNKDGQVTEDETKGKKEKMGTAEENQKNGVFQYVQDLYEKYIGGKQKKTEFSQDDFNQIIEKWKQDCLHNEEPKQKLEQF